MKITDCNETGPLPMQKITCSIQLVKTLTAVHSFLRTQMSIISFSDSIVKKNTVYNHVSCMSWGIIKMEFVKT